MYVVTVIFNRKEDGQERHYNYRVDDTLELNVGDYAVVESKYGLQYSTVEVVARYEYALENAEQFNKATAYIIDKVDLDAHLKRKEKADRLKFIKDELESKKAQAEEMMIFDALAKMDPDAAELIKEFKTLTLEMK